MPGTSPLLSGLILSGGAKGLSTSGFPADRAGRGSDFGTPASPVAVLGLAPPSPTASCPDLFRASTPCGIAVGAGRGRGGGGTWMPGTSPLLSGLDFQAGLCADGRERCRAGRAFSGHPLPPAVMPGLVPGIHTPTAIHGVDARNKSGHRGDRGRRRETPARRNVSSRPIRGRGPARKWMPGTSPGMTAGGRGWPEDARPARHRPRPWAHSPRRKSKPDSNGTSPGMTVGGRR